MKAGVVDIQSRWLDQVLALEQACFEDPWPQEAFAAELEHDWSVFLVSRGADPTRPDVLDGYCVSWMVGGELHLLRTAVAAQARRRGVGSRLLAHAVDRFAEQGGGLVILEVRVSNHAARGFYQARGFVPIGLREGYYPNNHEDAIIMGLQVAPAGARAGGGHA